MIIELPEMDFEKHHPNAVAIDPLLDKVRQLLDTKGVNRNEYALGSEVTTGFTELVIKKVNYFWLVCTTERGTNFDIAIFSNEFHAVNYSIFRRTGGKEIDICFTPGCSGHLTFCQSFFSLESQGDHSAVKKNHCGCKRFICSIYGHG